MRIRLQMGQATPVQRDGPKNQRIATAVGALLAPFAVLAAVVAIWRIAADISTKTAFPFEGGLFSHWAVWGATSVGLAWGANRLNKYGAPSNQGEPGQILGSQNRGTLH